MLAVIFCWEYLNHAAANLSQFCINNGAVMDKITKPVIIMMVLGVALIATLMTFGASDVVEQAKSNRAANQTPPAAQPAKESAVAEETLDNADEIPEPDASTELEISEFGEPIIDTTPLVGDFADEEPAEEVREGSDTPGKESSNEAGQAAQAAVEASSEESPTFDQ